MVLDEKKELSIEQNSFAEDGGVEKAPWASAPVHLHDLMKAGLSEEDAVFLHDMPKSEQSKIFHKVDWRLCPMLAVLYLISHLDRYVLHPALIKREC